MLGLMVKLLPVNLIKKKINYNKASDRHPRETETSHMNLIL